MLGETGLPVCGPTADDARPGVDTSAAAGEVAWCQPLVLPAIPAAEGGGLIGVEWACSSYAGDVFFCRSEVPSQVVWDGAPGRWDGPAYQWVLDRAWWPQRCESRTMPDRTMADCPPQGGVDGVVRCAVRGVGVLPGARERDISCLEFVRGPDDAEESHFLDKPLHCTTATTGPVTAEATTGRAVSPVAPDAGCGPAEGAGPVRGLLKDRRVVPRGVVQACAAFASLLPGALWHPPVMELADDPEEPPLVVGDDALPADDDDIDALVDMLAVAHADAVQQMLAPELQGTVVAPVVAVLPPDDVAEGPAWADQPPLLAGAVALAPGHAGWPPVVYLSHQAAFGDHPEAWMHLAAHLNAYQQLHPGADLSDPAVLAPIIAEAWDGLEDVPPLPVDLDDAVLAAEEAADAATEAAAAAAADNEAAAAEAAAVHDELRR